MADAAAVAGGREPTAPQPSTDEVVNGHTPAIALQVLALTAAARPETPVVSRDVADRLAGEVPADVRGRRREVLSVDEALRLLDA